MKDLHADLAATGFVFGESPRWHHGRLWFSDIFGGAVYSFGDHAGLSVEARVDRPSGLGWLPDGSLLVATLAREDCTNFNGPAVLYRVEKDVTASVVELDDPNTSFNDMVTLPSGRSYLNLYHGGAIGYDELLLVERDGSTRIVASNLFRPNGMAVAPDGRRLIVSETHNGHLNSFSIDHDGGLVDKTIVASDLELPDGLGNRSNTSWVSVGWQAS